MLGGDVDVPPNAQELFLADAGEASNMPTTMLDAADEPPPIAMPPMLGAALKLKSKNGKKGKKVRIDHDPADVTAVPMGVPPKRCSSEQCGTRPSMMTASPTPQPTASIAVPSLGIIPPVATPFSYGVPHKWMRSRSSPAGPTE